MQNIIIGVLLFLPFYFAMLICIIAIHEGLHILVLKDILKKDYRYKWIKKGLMFSVYSSYFDKNFFDMEHKQQFDYFKVAIAPYIFIVPFTYSMFLNTNTIISITGLCLLISHFMNLPLEFIYITEGKK